MVHSTVKSSNHLTTIHTPAIWHLICLRIQYTAMAFICKCSFAYLDELVDAASHYYCCFQIHTLHTQLLSFSDVKILAVRSYQLFLLHGPPTIFSIGNKNRLKLKMDRTVQAPQSVYLLIK